MEASVAGTIMGVSKFLKGKSSGIQIIGLQPSEGASIAGIRKWPQQYLPKIFEVAGCRCLAHLRSNCCENASSLRERSD